MIISFEWGRLVCIGQRSFRSFTSLPIISSYFHHIVLSNEYLLLICLHPVLIEGFDFPQLSFPWSLLLLINLQHIIVSSYPNILISNIPIISYPHILIFKYYENLKYHLLILLHCLSEVNNLAVLLLQHILEVAHRRVGGGGRRCELLVDRRGRALERLPWVPWQEMKPASLLLVDAVAPWKAVRLRSRPCWQVGKAPPGKGPAWVFLFYQNMMKIYLEPLGKGNWMPARFLNWGVPAPECLDLRIVKLFKHTFVDSFKVKDKKKIAKVSFF